MHFGATGFCAKSVHREFSGTDLLFVFSWQAVLVGCLKRLRVIRPASLFELLASIEVLRFELEHRPAVVAVDGMGSFFWQDKVITRTAVVRTVELLFSTLRDAGRNLFSTTYK